MSLSFLGQSCHQKSKSSTITKKNVERIKCILNKRATEYQPESGITDFFAIEEEESVFTNGVSLY